jgi:hypothetical protein
MVIYPLGGEEMVRKVDEPKKDQLTDWGYDTAILSGRVRQLRAAKRVSAVDAKDELQISAAGLAKIEGGTRGVSVRTLINLAKYYGVTMDYLVGLSDDDGGKLV